MKKLLSFLLPLSLTAALQAETMRVTIMAPSNDVDCMTWECDSMTISARLNPADIEGNVKVCLDICENGSRKCCGEITVCWEEEDAMMMCTPDNEELKFIVKVCRNPELAIDVTRCC
jgi:hypothetical protein